MNPYANIYLVTADEYRRQTLTRDFRSAQRGSRTQRAVHPHRLLSLVRRLRGLRRQRPVVETQQHHAHAA